MITHEDVAGLLPGDVVEMPDMADPSVVTRGPLHEGSNGRLMFGYRVIRTASGAPYNYGERLNRMTVVSRVPRPKPLYVNHDRTEPVQGDVVRLPDPRPYYAENLTWVYNGDGWYSLHSADWRPIIGSMPRGMVLLVDGSTGRAVA